MSAAKRRRRQHAIGFTHIAKIGRPVYRRKAAEKSARQNERWKLARSKGLV